MRAPSFKCPYCGWIYDGAYELVPEHEEKGDEEERFCPGSFQIPRDVNDSRPLWSEL